MAIYNQRFTINDPRSSSHHPEQHKPQGANLNLDELRALLQLTTVPGIGPTRIRALVGHFHSAQAALSASVSALSQVSGIDRTLAENILQHGDADFAARQLEILAQRNARLLTYWDEDYPTLLKKIPDPPALLYMAGELPSSEQSLLAVVGTRAPTQYGKLVVEKLTAELAARGFTIVSGLARGIDTIAHRTALKSGGRTLAVLGSGLDVMYPAENEKLAQEIVTSGAVLSEYPFGAKPDAVNFPRRNRIISGLSLGVLVIEAGLESGAMITANLALEHNREVFAVPGSIMSMKSAGPHQLIREGAKLVHSVDDVLEELLGQLDFFGRQRTEEKPAPELEEKSKRIYDLLSHEGLHIDELIRKTGLSSAEMMTLLLELEFKNLVKQLPGKFFVKS